MSLRQTLQSIWLLLLGLAHATPVLAQTGADPFARQTAEMLRAADAHLEFLRAPKRESLGEVARVNTVQRTVNRRDPLAEIAEGRVENAQRQLLRLGVDARRLFFEEGVPSQMLVVAEVESGFDPSALSIRGARGVWQLMPDTARRFGLRVDNQVDERLQVGRSTRAAARYLRELFLLFEDWELTLAAYNAGERRVSKLTERVGAREFSLVAGLLPSETRRYVPAVLSGLVGKPPKRDVAASSNVPTRIGSSERRTP